MLKSRSNGDYSVDRRCRIHARCILLREVYTVSWDAEVSRERADRAERGDDHRSVIASQICRTLCRSFVRILDPLLRSEIIEPPPSFFSPRILPRRSQRRISADNAIITSLLASARADCIRPSARSCEKGLLHMQSLAPVYLNI